MFGLGPLHEYLLPVYNVHTFLEFGLWNFCGCTVCSPGEHIPDIFTFSISIPASLYLHGDKIVHAENMYYSCNAHLNFLEDKQAGRLYKWGDE